MTTETKTRKKGAATVLIGTLVAGGLLVGGTFANLNQSITDGATTHEVRNDAVIYDHEYTVDSGVINANISINEAATVAALKAQNIGSISSQQVFFIDQASLAAIDYANPIFDETTVTAVFATEAGNATWNGTLANFFKTAFVTDLIVAPTDVVTVSVTINPQTEGGWSSTVAAAAMTQLFGTSFTFNQVSAGTSPLYTYAAANGTQIGTANAYTLPVASLGGITL